MNDYTPKILDILAYQQVITNQGENYTGEKDWALNKLKSLIAESIAQAEQEMLKRVEEMRDAPPPYSADKENPMKHIYQNQGYARALDDLLSSLEKDTDTLDYHLSN